MLALRARLAEAEADEGLVAAQLHAARAAATRRAFCVLADRYRETDVPGTGYPVPGTGRVPAWQAAEAQGTLAAGGNETAHGAANLPTARPQRAGPRCTAPRGSAAGSEAG